MDRNRFIKNSLLFGLGVSVRHKGLLDILNNTPFPKLKGHPRLFFSKGEEKLVLKKMQEDGLLSSLLNSLKAEARKTLNSSPLLYKSNAVLLSTSREEIKRVLTLSLAYRLFREDNFAKKVEDELQNVCSFSSWHPEHFLDVAEMTTAVSIGYDWCYNYLSDSTKALVEKAIIEKSFGPAWPIYKNTNIGSPFKRYTNWNMVCNSGMVNGAIAIGDKYPKDAAQVVRYALKNTPNLLHTFAPEGVYNEGPTYWGYNAIYMVLFFDNLIRNIGNDFGLPKYTGINNTSHFYMNLVGPTGKTFNFADASTRVTLQPTFFFLSKYYRQPKVAKFYRNLLKRALEQYNKTGDYNFPRFFFLSIPWFDNAQLKKEQEEKKFNILHGVTDILTLNGDYESNPNRLYLAAKTGRPNWPHNQLDVGSFVVDSQGERWGIDLGAERYDLPGFWDYRSGGRRWNYFRNTNLAHNTITIDGKLSNPEGQGQLVQVNYKNTNTIFDITASYKGQANSVLRGFRLLSSNTIFIRDEIKLTSISKKVSWRFLTKAKIKIAKNTIILSQNGKKFYIHCLIEESLFIDVFDAQPNSPAEKPITDVHIIEVTIIPKDKLATIPIIIGNDLKEIKNKSSYNLPLDSWN